MLEKTVIEWPNLSEREKEFLQLRFAANGEIIRTFKEVGTHLNVSKQRVYAIQIRVLEKINGKIRLTIRT